MSQPEYGSLMSSPPGAVVAPKGFPADPRPTQGSKVFRDAMEIRVKVFCEEQNCSLEAELDEDDLRSWHWVMYHTFSDRIEPASVIRIVPPPHDPHPNGFSDPNERPYVKLGRVATMPAHRGKGLSRALTETALQWSYEHRQEISPEWDGLVLCHAQVSVEKMYGKLGFVTDERLGRWMEEGIEHLGMWRDLKLSQPSDPVSSASVQNGVSSNT
ncbi:uncharacterized protein Z520_09478 [Fonsecaea multimorphosa CBS 102226]|uniref:N-acetyltransferase domain-containing protein n=1 Tax=Fonsecaea multimorphosa CBS 102226 TaxID=1442371 RepID=A0A0D2KDJ8_9EURO|nr:uncharacterized protein Z520_09478 [Fonsecaea multimorphosa CBS 102226]KIX94788.1 hypothetical protein Z520_09478 [Fonsecaea multimorphosa CBS 102226]OAL20369.1 hypothetical protein AYO22_08863 [Fonsecaea multimorphosa]